MFSSKTSSEEVYIMGGGLFLFLSPLWCNNPLRSQQYWKLLSFSLYSVNKTVTVYNFNIAMLGLSQVRLYGTE